MRIISRSHDYVYNNKNMDPVGTLSSAVGLCFIIKRILEEVMSIDRRCVELNNRIERTAPFLHSPFLSLKLERNDSTMTRIVGDFKSTLDAIHEFLLQLLPAGKRKNFIRNAKGFISKIISHGSIISTLNHHNQELDRLLIEMSPLLLLDNAAIMEQQHKLLQEIKVTLTQERCAALVPENSYTFEPERSNDFDTRALLGRGSFGDIYRVKHRVSV